MQFRERRILFFENPRNSKKVEERREDAASTGNTWLADTVLLLRTRSRERSARRPRKGAEQRRKAKPRHSRGRSRGEEQREDGDFRAESRYHDRQRESGIASLLVPRGQRSVDEVPVLDQRNDRHEERTVSGRPTDELVSLKYL